MFFERRNKKRFFNFSIPKLDQNAKKILKSRFVFALAFTLIVPILSHVILNYTPGEYLKLERNSVCVLSLLILSSIILTILWRFHLRSPKIYKQFYKHVILNRSPFSSQSNWVMVSSPLLLKTTSHLFFDRFIFFTMGSTLSSIMGVDFFVPFYLIASVWCSFASLTFAQLNNKITASSVTLAMCICLATIQPFPFEFGYWEVPGGFRTVGILTGFNFIGCFFRVDRFSFGFDTSCAVNFVGCALGFLVGLFLLNFGF